MSAGLAAGVEPASVDACLAEIDAQIRNYQGLPHETPAHVTAGAFALLNFAVPKQQKNLGLPDDNDGPTDTSPDEPVPFAGHPQTPPAFALDNFLVVDHSLSWDDLFGIGMEDVASSTHAVLGDSDTLFWPGVPDNSPESTRWAPECPSVLAPATTTVASSHSTPGEPATDHHTNTIQTPQDSMLVSVADSQFLLQNFRKNLASITCAPPLGQKSPWEILHLASAVQTLADTTFLYKEKVTHARKANYYGVLSCSAFHLFSNRGDLGGRLPEYVESLASSTLTRAVHHMQRSLKTERSGPGKSKYKDQLMALLILVNRSVSGPYQSKAWGKPLVG